MVGHRRAVLPKSSVRIERDEGVAALGLAPNGLKARREAISKMHE
jgi:hypothetical protein